MDLNIKLRNIIKRIKFNIEIIDLGSVKFKIKWQKTLN
jgi:hypothetical protein